MAHTPRMTSQEKKKRIKIHETTLENDIRYRGPLTAQHFKLLGWLCLAGAHIMVILRLGGRLNPEFAMNTNGLLSLFQIVSNLSLPFLLISVFAQLLNTDEGYSKSLLVNSAAMVGICALFYLVFYRYIVGGIASFLTDPSEALPNISTLLFLVAPYGFFAFNLFVDLFLCTLTMLFLNYNPRRVFKGKSRFFFRLLALLPIAYEVGCMLLKVRSARGMLQIPIWAWPFLTVKPPMTFVLFVTLALFVKLRERRFRRHGKSYEEYQEFLKTRRNSLNFSVFLSIMMVLVSLADLLVMAGFSLNEVAVSLDSGVKRAVIERLEESGQEVPEDLDALISKVVENYEVPTATPETVEALPEVTPSSEEMIQAMLLELTSALEQVEQEESAPEMTPAPISAEDAVKEALDRFYLGDVVVSSVDSGMSIAEAVGFGGSVGLFFLAPLVLLFSYTRRAKNRLLDMMIPAAGVVLILIVYVEGFHQLLPLLPVDKVNLQELKDILFLYVDTLQ